MKTAEEIITYLEEKLDQAYQRHNETKRLETYKAYTSLVKIVLLEELLEEIKK